MPVDVHQVKVAASQRSDGAEAPGAQSTESTRPHSDRVLFERRCVRRSLGFRTMRAFPHINYTIWGPLPASHKPGKRFSCDSRECAPGRNGRVKWMVGEGTHSQQLRVYAETGAFGKPRGSSSDPARSRQPSQTRSPIRSTSEPRSCGRRIRLAHRQRRLSVDPDFIEVCGFVLPVVGMHVQP